jgi:tetratricopeptide (TPR) repeat protein
MFSKHPTQADFEDFLRGTSQSSAGARSKVVRHLLGACADCRRTLSDLGWDSRRLNGLMEFPGTESEEMGAAPSLASTNSYDYAQAFAVTERALECLLSRDNPEGNPPDELLANLDGLAEIDQLRLIHGDERFGSPQLVKLLIERSHRARYEDPAQMLHLAHLAQAIAEVCQVEAVGNEPKLADLRMRAWGHYGNSLRVSGQLREAEQALAKARRYAEAGTGDPPLHARLFEQMASFEIFRRNFAEAIEYADQAGQIYRDLGEAHLLASSLVHKAIATLYSGDPGSAAEMLNQAIPMIDHEEEPHLLVAASHNLVHCYVDLGQPEQALHLFLEVKELYGEFKDALILLRASWEEGRLLRELGHLRAAETALLRARKGFLERGLAYEVAVVSLELAAVYAKLGAVEDLKGTVAGTMPIFRSLRVGRETLASLIHLQRVADQESQALELIQLLSTRLESLSKQRPLE